MKPHPILSTSFLSGYRNNPPLFITLKSNFSFKSHGILSLSPVITSCSLSLPSAIFSLKPRSVIKFAPRLTRLLCSSVLAHQATATLNPELAALPHDLIQQGPKLVFRTTRREGAKTVFRWATRAASRDRIKGEKSQEIESISASAASREISRNFKKMAKRYRSLYFIAILVAVFVSAPPAGAFTDLLDVVALRDLYMTLNQPPQLKGWRLDGGNPCDESWDGVSCFGSSVIYLKLNGLNLSGYITPEIYNLYSLKQLDISSNSIGGEIPYVLPPNATHINMAYNHLIQNIPPSLPGMKSLRHLNLSHNLLSGPIGNVFTGLQNLREMDLSCNNFTGDLPSSFGSLTNLTGLYLQNNQFTGSVAYLAELPLIDLNIKDNSFSGIIPSHFQSIPNLWIGGNSFRLPGDNYPPWDFPLQMQGGVIEQNIHPPSATQSSAMEKSNPSTKVGGHRKWWFGPKGIALVIGGGTVVVSCVVVYVLVRYTAYRFNKLRAQRLGASSSSCSFSFLHPKS